MKGLGVTLEIALIAGHHRHHHRLHRRADEASEPPKGQKHTLDSGVDKGQMEAGRSLGLTKAQTMKEIVLPQAFKNVLPPIGNEFITLIKETAIVGYVSLSDLTRTASQISSRTYEAFMPLIGAAVIYFVLIKILTLLLEAFERRLRRSDIR